MEEINIYEKYVRTGNAELKRLGSSEIDKEEYKNILADELVEMINRKLSIIFLRNLNYIKALETKMRNLGKTVYNIKVMSISRVLVNTNSSMGWLIDEVGFDWDPILDTPIIPASEIKGTLATAFQYLIPKYAQELGIKKIDKKLLEDLRDTVFGNGGVEGWKSIIDVTDGYPVGYSGSLENAKIVEREVITPIYKESPEEHKAKPTPIHFIVLAPNVYFRFLLIIDLELANWVKNEVQNDKLKHYVISKLLDDKLRSNFLQELVEMAFNRIGIGAKTSSGYGLFKYISGF